ncbi:reverse transcriptase domain, reverse transcriptase zinc-binding domain protein [Tanacetum coccineum]
MGLWYPKDTDFELTASSDSDHAGCLDIRKITSGGIQFLGGDKLVSWSSKKQDCTSMSSAEAEYHFIKEQVEKGIIELLFVETEYQLADLFTKALSEDRFKYLIRRIGMRCLTPEELEDIMKEDVVNCVKNFESSARVISSVIGPNQTTFIAGRQILDGCLVANEIIRMAKLEGHKMLLIKVDFEKVFDSVNWSFLQDIKWRKWIGACLSSASISILINGSPSKEFKMERGLRQGDPLSPLLFLLVAEALHVAVLEACNKGVFKGVLLAVEGTNLSLLQYADDTLFFGELSRLNASNLIYILKCFEGSSGLKVNISKSRLTGVGVPMTDVEQVSWSLGCSCDRLPFLYLGLPVGRNMRTCGGWNEVLDRFNARLSAWNAKNLSI